MYITNYLRFQDHPRNQNTVIRFVSILRKSMFLKQKISYNMQFEIKQFLHKDIKRCWLILIAKTNYQLINQTHRFYFQIQENMKWFSI